MTVGTICETSPSPNIAGPLLVAAGVAGVGYGVYKTYCAASNELLDSESSDSESDIESSGSDNENSELDLSVPITAPNPSPNPRPNPRQDSRPDSGYTSVSGDDSFYRGGSSLSGISALFRPRPARPLLDDNTIQMEQVPSIMDQEQGNSNYIPTPGP